ncbi:recombinase family protein [Steroidobacter sp. S1-65]|uniref:Recombinase family protein n=1 Tax=Steroidobacter gossypii TaxID=2805490 RepID=A0ABS1X5V8_9GAMM|nr:recombinase family protein [Steroidobacter gossypii]MBM0108613.1 recombinase family protein [Steroidobacter gossypii]
MVAVRSVISAPKVALYARYSSDQQRAASIEDQFRNCRRKADAENWCIAETYADEAMSGADSNRPQYQAMLAAANRREFDVLLIDDLSRLSRDQVESERVIRRLEFLGIRIVAVTDGYDSETKSATRKIQRGVKNLINEMRLDELREQVHRGLTGQAMKNYWCGGRPYGYRLKPILDPTQKDAYGESARIGTVLEIDSDQAAVISEIFESYARGISYFSIARSLNERGVASPGSTWKRKVRRCRGWVASAVRVILRNPLYTGLVRWNVSQFVRDPDTGKHKRCRRSEKEWVRHRDESLRIVSDDLFERVREGMERHASNDKRLKSGGKSKFLLSGLLYCATCGANYVMGDGYKYACSSYLHGRACSNAVRVRRDKAEAVILGGIHEQLRDPDRVTLMVAEMQKHLTQLLREHAARSHEAPQELKELEARLDRLRRRLKDGDPDMTTDELQAAIERAEAKHRQLQRGLQGGDVGRVLEAVPRAAELCDERITLGLSGDAKASEEARLVLRELIPDRIRLSPKPDGSLWAHSAIHPAALLLAAGYRGRGDRI